MKVGRRDGHSLPAGSSRGREFFPVQGLPRSRMSMKRRVEALSHHMASQQQQQRRQQPTVAAAAAAALAPQLPLHAVELFSVKGKVDLPAV